MLLRTDPFADFDRITAQLFRSTRPATAPLDAYRDAEAVYVLLDLPGVDPASIDATVERNVLTVRAERRRDRRDGVKQLIAERPTGTVTRQLVLADSLDTDRLAATYDAGVLTVRIPVGEKAKPRKITIETGGTRELAAV